MVWMSRVIRGGVTLVVLALIGAGGWAGYRMAKSQVEAEVYRERLVQVADQYEQLRATYNQAVRRTAVTELLVENGELCVVIRTVEGVEKKIPTPFDPTREIYVDYVVRDGRLWIRRVFDDRTAPESGVLIDLGLADVDWDGPGVAYGKAAYRRLGEGRWIVSVTGDGSLGLAKVAEGEVVELSPPAQVRDYQELEEQVRVRLDDVGVGEVFWRMLH